jgi:hypothetical protein
MRKTTTGPNQLALWTRVQIQPGRKPAVRRPAWAVTIAQHIQAAQQRA